VAIALQTAIRMRWVVIVVESEASRVDGLTARLFGANVPKPLAPLAGGRSLLEETLDRFASVAPPEQTVVVARRALAARIGEKLGARPRARIVAAPAHRGTGPAALLAVAEIAALDPRAEVVVTPADHHVAQPAPLLAGVEVALAAARRQRGVTLVGITAHAPSTDRAWVVPGTPLAGGGYEVSRVVDRPVAGVARTLQIAGGLWSSGVVVGTAPAILDVAARARPAMIAAIRDHVRDHGGVGDAYALAALADGLPSADLILDVLVPSRALAVVAVARSGWCDFATPERVLAGRDDAEGPIATTLRAFIDRGAAP
jgi:mannose-1-phosphate guanylyltransferase